MYSFPSADEWRGWLLVADDWHLLPLLVRELLLVDVPVGLTVTRPAGDTGLQLFLWALRRRSPGVAHTVGKVCVVGSVLGKYSWVTGPALGVWRQELPVHHVRHQEHRHHGQRVLRTRPNSNRYFTPEGKFHLGLIYENNITINTIKMLEEDQCGFGRSKVGIYSIRNTSSTI